MRRGKWARELWDPRPVTKATSIALHVTSPPYRAEQFFHLTHQENVRSQALACSQFVDAIFEVLSLEVTWDLKRVYDHLALLSK
jgi:hypothetical protein